MASAELQAVASAVLRRAQKHGYVVPRDVRDELAAAGQEETRWKEVIELLRESLHYRQGRYFFISPSGSSSLQEEQKQLDRVRDVLRGVLGQPEQPDKPDRRQEQRIAYTRAVKIQTEDNHELTVLSQDLSPSGIRFIANRSLLGRRVRVHLTPAGESDTPVVLLARILWTTSAGEGLYENGGSFQEMISGRPGAAAPTESP